MSRKKEYIQKLNSHIDAVKASESFPKSGVITITYDIETESFISTIDSGVSAKDAGNNGDPFP